MGFLSKLIGDKTRKNAKITVLGESGAGKTTFVHYCEKGKEPDDPDQIKATLGIDVRKKPVKVDNWKLSVIDVGGQDLYRTTFWNLSLSQADALIYIIDGTVRPKDDDDSFEVSLFSFEYMLELLPPDKPVLVIVNKQDLVKMNPMSDEEARKAYNLDRLSQQGRRHKIYCGSAYYGHGINDALKWFVTAIDDYVNRNKKNSESANKQFQHNKDLFSST